MIWYQITYGIFCILFALLNAKLIEGGKRIYHGLNGLLHLGVAIAGFYFFNWQTGLACLFIARVVFDWSLSLFRGLPLGYVSLNPKSIVDQVEKKVFGLNGISPKILYIIIIIILNFIP